VIYTNGFQARKGVEGDICKSASTQFKVLGSQIGHGVQHHLYRGFLTLIIGVHLDFGLAPNTSVLSIVGEFKNRCHHYVKIHPLG
jgi:hypothetical protein